MSYQSRPCNTETHAGHRDLPLETYQTVNLCDGGERLPVRDSAGRVALVTSLHASVARVRDCPGAHLFGVLGILYRAQRGLELAGQRGIVDRPGAVSGTVPDTQRVGRGGSGVEPPALQTVLPGIVDRYTRTPCTPPPAIP